VGETPSLRLGYWLSSEEHGPNELVRYAARAEQAGFAVAGISDHYHPWVRQQGLSPFVWATLGGIAGATSVLEVVTGVTAPIMRIHPAIIAQAAASVEVMFEGRFALGVGTGERLNEHVVGGAWPRPDVRRDMLAEAISILRRLWDGEMLNHYGEHYTVEKAQLFTLPHTPPPIFVAGSSKKSAKLAGQLGDGFFGVAPSQTLVEVFEGAGGRGKPRVGQIHVCWADTREEALDTAYKWWPNAALQGALLSELLHPTHFEQALTLARPDDVASSVALGPDPEMHLQAIASFASVGFNEVHVHQIGPDQEGFFRFYEQEIFPRLPNVVSAPLS
jgi:coenzyme F420-dependent glucose-6-phosphate dehydrogenase